MELWGSKKKGRINGFPSKLFTFQPIEVQEKNGPLPQVRFSPDSAMLRGIAVEVEGAPQGWDWPFHHTWNGGVHL